MLRQLTKLLAVSAAFFSVTSSLDGIRHDVRLKKAAETAESFVSCQKFAPPTSVHQNS